MRVLLVEDDEGIREGMGQILSAHALTVGVGNVPGALAALEDDPYDLVIADLRLGAERAGGRIVCRAAQARKIPVAIMSAVSQSELIASLRGAVPDAILPKPFQIEELEALVLRYAARH